MRIKLWALASVCMLALSVSAAQAKPDLSEDPVVSPNALALTAPLPTVDVLAEHGIASLDFIKSRVDQNGMTFVAQTTTGTKSVTPTTVAVAQLGTPADQFSYGLVGALLVLIAGGFMWLSLMHQRRED